jgi:hypothetical protein
VRAKPWARPWTLSASAAWRLSESPQTTTRDSRAGFVVVVVVAGFVVVTAVVAGALVVCAASAPLEHPYDSTTNAASNARRARAAVNFAREWR